MVQIDGRQDALCGRRLSRFSFCDRDVATRELLLEISDERHGIFALRGRLGHLAEAQGEQGEATDKSSWGIPM